MHFMCIYKILYYYRLFTYRLELFLSVWLAGALLCRMYVVLNPDFDYPIITAPQLYTSFADVNVVVIWILMGSILLSSMRRMSAVVSEMGAFKELLWTMAKNLLTFSPMFLLYDFWLIDFVYTTWTCKFALLVRALQTFPAGTLLAHSIYQHSFISMCKRNVFEEEQRKHQLCSCSKCCYKSGYAPPSFVHNGWHLQTAAFRILQCSLAYAA